MRIKKFDPEINVNLDQLDHYKDLYRKGLSKDSNEQCDGIDHNIVVCVVIKNSTGPKVDMKDVILELGELPDPERLLTVLLLSFPSIVNEKLGQIMIDQVKLRFPGKEAILDEMLARNDQGPYYALIARQYFREYGSKQYLIAEDFYNYFATADIKKLTYGMLPRNVSGFVQLPKVFGEGSEQPVECFYYAIGDNDYLPGIGISPETAEPDREAKGKMVVSWYRDGYHSYIFEAIYDDHILVKDAAFNRFSYVNDYTGMKVVKKEEFFKGTVQFIFCLISYIHSGKPDVREFQNKIRMSKKNGRMVVRSKDQGLAQDPISLVGFGWKKPRNYEHSITEVAPYPATRWYGPGRAKTRTVWVTGHTREYGKDNV